MSAVHTPGPWFVAPDCTVCAHDPEEPQVPWVVARVGLGCGYPEIQDGANALLIAAAPELLEVLRNARICLIAVADSALEAGFDQLADIIDDQLADANAAIAKALGTVSLLSEREKGEGE